MRQTGNPDNLKPGLRRATHAGGIKRGLSAWQEGSRNSEIKPSVENQGS
ncbi:hypothetical protein NSMM_820024 [Nitrosomonas mobilis]|uniref:Uncharacterized protein n=1 Tax=Nitrosomonas mobilis TaxID=51642 RepID=A0A1G5SKN5_9PROT|nr:hypothetical protein NSMM_820024 [Nitrosomonas mobilis]